MWVTLRFQLKIGFCGQRWQAMIDFFLFFFLSLLLVCFFIIKKIGQQHAFRICICVKLMSCWLFHSFIYLMFVFSILFIVILRNELEFLFWFDVLVSNLWKSLPISKFGSMNRVIRQNLFWIKAVFSQDGWCLISRWF